MKQFFLKSILPIGLLAIVLLATIYIDLSGSPILANLRVQMAEFLTVHVNGPRLGRRPASKEIVLIDFDWATGNELGHIRSFTDDAALYRKLDSAGVAMVYDSRNAVAASKEELERIRPALDAVMELNGLQSMGTSNKEPTEGQKEVESRPPIRFFLDAWLKATIDDEDLSKYTQSLTLNPLASSPHAIESARARLYPFACVSSWGLKETAPLKLARRVWGLEQVEIPVVNEELYACGILTEWHRQYPSQTAPVQEPRSPLRVGTEEIPWNPFDSTSILVLPAGLWVSHDPLVSEYRRISYLEILKSEQLDALDLRGKIVIIGYTIQTDPSSDTYDLPSGNGKSVASEMIALATQTLVDRRWLQPVPKHIGMGSLVLLCVALTGLTTMLKPVQAMLASTAVLFAYFVISIAAYRLGWFMDFALAPLAGVACAVLGGTLCAWKNHRVHSRVVDMFGRYVPRAVVNQLILQPQLEALRLGGTKREMSVLFADIRGFTTFSEKLPPDQVVAELNSILKIMVECTFEHQGTLDKFIGDAILVLFNAPLDQSDHVMRAVRMAIDMQSRLANHCSNLSIGIGVHVGQAIVGNIGTPERMEYTAIGSTVNIASRLCDVAQAGKVIVSSEVANLLDGQFDTVSVGPVKVKGISDPIEIWEVRKAT